MDGVASITSSINKVTRAVTPRTLSGSSNRVVRGASYLARADNEGLETSLKIRSPTGEKYSYKSGNSDYKNLELDVLDAGLL
jgi:hypothetical protein